jgi:hypothetical protein
LSGRVVTEAQNKTLGTSRKCRTTDTLTAAAENMLDGASGMLCDQGSDLCDEGRRRVEDLQVVRAAVENRLGKGRKKDQDLASEP